MAFRILVISLLTPCFVLIFGHFSPNVIAGDARATNSPAVPALMLPADGDTTTGLTHPPLGVPTLAWDAIGTADRYRVEISTSAGFADPIVEQITYANSYTPIYALADGEYFWRVKAGFGIEWGEYSEIRTFVKDWDADGTIVPTLISPPEDSKRRAFGHKDFSWSPVSGAAGYLLEIATDATFSTVIYSAKSTKATHTPTTNLNNTRYYWRVTPYDNQDNFGLPSDSFSFSFDWDIAPEPLSPAHDVDLVYSPTLSWTAVEGARRYILEIDTEDDFPSPQVCTCYTTNFTWYKNLSNDQEYFWRVKAVDNADNSSPWSTVRRFRIKWDFEAKLLSPNNNVIHQAAPYFSWQPIPGAERYQFQVDESTSFERPKTDIEIHNVTHAGITKIIDRDTFIDRDYFWRVRGIDAQDNVTPWTEIHSFRFGYETSPSLVYPPVYYEPDLANLPDARDDTIDHPLFVWNGAHRWMPYPFYAEAADFYEITAASNPALTDIHFQAETPNLAASPTIENPFNSLADGELVYWRVRAYADTAAPFQIGTDATWTTRIDTTLASLPVTNTMSVIYPVNGFTTVEIPPVLGWLPVDGADHYRIQIGRSDDFATDSIVEDVRPQFPNYVPGLGTRVNVGYGTFWWRVRAQDSSGAGISDWSAARHYNVAAELINGNRYDLVTPPYPTTIMSETVEVDDQGTSGVEDDEITAMFSGTWTKVASDINDGLSKGELTDLHVMLNRIDLRHTNYPNEPDNYNWVMTFPADLTAGTPVYAVFIDVDHVAGSGASVDPYSLDISFDDLYLPEYALFVRASANSDFPEGVELFSWNGAAWNPAQTLATIGGDAWHTSVDGAIQLHVPYTALGPGEEIWSGSLAMAVYSLEDTVGGPIYDSLPDQGETMDAPIFVSDMLTPLYPFDSPLSDPIVFEDLPALRWRVPPFGSIDGYQIEIARDALFTDIVETWETKEDRVHQYFAMLTSTFQSANAYEDNESYYWRVRLKHERFTAISSQFDYGPWSPPMRFRLASRTVGNPQVSTGELANTTPAFTWDRVEGAAGYRIEIDDDINFSDPEFAQDIDSNSYASVGAMWDGTWYWRVAIRRSSKVRGEWSPTMSFVKRSLEPQPVSPIDEAIINEQPTFQWSAILTPTLQPRVSSPSYRLELDNDPNFSAPQVYETDMTSFTLEPRKNLADGPWYWRVAMLDAVDNVGRFSAPQQFYKEYLPPDIAAPSVGSIQSTIPNFRWQAMDGAAYYEFEYADNNLFNRSRKVKTDNVHYTPTTLLDGSEYFWRVRMYDDDNNPGPFIIGRVAIIYNGIYLPFVR